MMSMARADKKSRRVCFECDKNPLEISLQVREKTLMLGGIEGRRRRGRQDEMAGWYHRLDGHEFG